VGLFSTVYPVSLDTPIIVSPMLGSVPHCCDCRS